MCYPLLPPRSSPPRMSLSALRATYRIVSTSVLIFCFGIGLGRLFEQLVEQVDVYVLLDLESKSNM